MIDMFEAAMRLREAAKTIEDANNKKLALYFGFASDFLVYMLYDAAALLKLVKQWPGKNVYDSELIKKIAYSSVYATIVVNPPTQGQHGVGSVDASAARDGYGPLMYDIVMALEHGLTPDRMSVTTAAKNVWKRYFDDRPDVKHLPLDHAQAKFTATTTDDSSRLHPDSPENTRDFERLLYSPDVVTPEFRKKVRDDLLKNPLNYAYFNENMPNVSKLVQNNEQVLKKLRSMQDMYRNPNVMLRNAARAFFDIMY